MSKKSILSGFFAIALMTVAGLGLNKSKNNATLSNLTLSNVEALASIESEDCVNGCADRPGRCYCKGWYDYDEAVWH